MVTSYTIRDLACGLPWPLFAKLDRLRADISVASIIHDAMNPDGPTLRLNSPQDF
jgi:hypothetical protein